MKHRILVVEDEKNIREGLAAALSLDGHDIVLASDGNEGLSHFLKGDIDLVLSDLRMPGLSGEKLLERIMAESPGTPVIILTGHGTVETAVKAMHLGAWDFITKPLNLDYLSILVKKALDNRELYLKHRRLEEELERHKRFEDIIGKSAVMRKVFDTTSRAAPTKASILITGESGTGKELIADAIHGLSPRKDKP